MQRLSITTAMRSLKSNKSYIFYSIAYGLSSLILPFGIQFLVNNLALSGIWLNTVSFLVLIGLGLVISQIVRHSQVILIEFLEREVFIEEMRKWKNFNNEKYAHYYFEVINVLKAFSKSYTSLIEIALVMTFGISTIIIFHPAFIILAFIIGLTVYQIYKSSEYAIKTSIQESNEKYHIYDQVVLGKGVSDEGIDKYLSARDVHFSFTRKNSFKISVLTIFIQVILLGIGCYLILNNQLSVGQLVSAELIISGIFVSLVKLPKTLESVYDYETSQYKIAGAMKGHHHE
jgi:ABC-type protease/lipase transport system fused ATPase/permease subunit